MSGFHFHTNNSNSISQLVKNSNLLYYDLLQIQNRLIEVIKIILLLRISLFSIQLIVLIEYRIYFIYDSDENIVNKDISPLQYKSFLLDKNLKKSTTSFFRMLNCSKENIVLILVISMENNPSCGFSIKVSRSIFQEILKGLVVIFL